MDIIRNAHGSMAQPHLKYRFGSSHRIGLKTEYTLREWMLGIPEGEDWVAGTLCPIKTCDTLSDRTPREPQPRGVVKWDRRRVVEVHGGRERVIGKIEYYRAPAQWLVEGIVPSGSLGVIIPCVGHRARTALSCNLAVAMACGTPWPILAGKDKRTGKPQTWDDEYSIRDRASALLGKNTHTSLCNINMEGRVLYLAGHLEAAQEHISAALSGRTEQETKAFERNFILAPIGSSSLGTEPGISKIATEIGIASSKWTTTIRSWTESEDDEMAYQVPEAVFYDAQLPATSLNVAEIVRDTLGRAGNVGLELQKGTDRVKLMGYSGKQTTLILVNTDEATIGTPDFQLGTGRDQTKLVVYHKYFPSPFTWDAPLKTQPYSK